MNRVKPVAYDVLEGEDRFVLVLRCVPLKGPIVTMQEIDGSGFEFTDEDGGCIRFANPHARMRGVRNKAMILVMIDGDDFAIATTQGACHFEESMALIPSEFLWHHDRTTSPGDYADRPLAHLVGQVRETTAGVLCAPPSGAPVSACVHRRMAALSGDREWTAVLPRLIIDAKSLRTVVEVPEGVAEAVAEAFNTEGRPSSKGAAWRSQLAVRLAA